MTTRSLRSYGAAGDGRTDDGPALRLALADATLDTLVIEDTGAGYWLDTSPGWMPAYIFSRTTIRGEGWGSRLIRGGTFNPHSFIFANRNQVNGNHGIRLEGVHVEGRWDAEAKGVAWIGPGNPNMTLIKLAADNSLGHYVQGFEMLNCRVRNFPGIVLSALAHKFTTCEYNQIDRISGGGLIFRFVCMNVLLKDNRITRACDDTIAFNARVSGNPNDARDGASYNCVTRENVLSRFNPTWAGGSATAPVYSIRGGRSIHSFYDRIIGSAGAGVGITRSVGVSDVHFNQMAIEDTPGPAIEVGAGCAGSATILTRNAGAVANASPERFRITRKAKP